MLAVLFVTGAAACGLDAVGGRAESVAPGDDAAVDRALPVDDGGGATDAPQDDAATVDASFDADADAGADACVPSPTGLVSFWTADGDLADHHGVNGGVSGTQSGAVPVTFGAGFSDQAFALGGNSYVQVADAVSLRFTTGITMEARVRSATFGGRIVDKITAGTADGYLLDTYQSKLRIIIGGTSVSSPATLPANAWTHVAGTWDGTTARVYVNGVQAASVAAASLPSNTLALRIGADNTGASRFAGAIDEVAVYGRALSAAEITALAALGPTQRCK